MSYVAGSNSFWPHFHFIRAKRKTIQMLNILESTSNWMSSYSLYVSTIVQLNSLSNNELKELGMTREQILFEAAKHFARV